MEQVLISFSRSDFQDLIADAVTACIKRNTPQQQNHPNQDDILTVPQAAEFLSLSIATIYGLIHKGELPAMKRGNRAYFMRSELIEYLKQGRKRKRSQNLNLMRITIESGKRKETTMTNTTSPQNNKRQGKDINRSNQLQTILQYLKKHIATGSMVSVATGIYQKNICRYKRELEKAGLLWEVKKKACEITGFKAWFLTTDPTKAPKRMITQLNLFLHETSI